MSVLTQGPAGRQGSQGGAQVGLNDEMVGEWSSCYSLKMLAHICVFSKCSKAGGQAGRGLPVNPKL